jgi:hypothetical protein
VVFRPVPDRRADIGAEAAMGWVGRRIRPVAGATSFVVVPNRDIVIDPAFEGPPASAHGGYASGLLSPYLPADAEITLMKPVRLGVVLRLEPRDGGLDLYDGQTIVAEAVTTRLVSRAPEPPTVAEAWAASAAGWAAMWFGQVDAAAVLGRMAAWLAEPVAAHDAHVLVGWLEGVSGRKLYAGSALYSPSGALQGFSRQTWITIARTEAPG